jgi:hypothetical protein
MAILSDPGLRLNLRSFNSVRELERIRTRELAEQFLRGRNDRIRRSSGQLQRDVNGMPLQHSRDDKTPLELFRAAVQRCDHELRSILNFRTGRY